MLDAIVRFLGERGSLAQPDALEFLAGLPDAVRALARATDGAADGLPFILTLADARRLVGAPIVPAPPTVESALSDAPRPMGASAPAPPVRPMLPPPAPSPLRAPPPSVTLAPAVRAPPARLVAPHARPTTAPEPQILADVTGVSTCEGSIDDFAKLFRDRFNRMRRLYRKRREMVGATTIERMARNGQPVKFLAIVNEVRTTKNGHRLIEVEDDTGQVAILAPKSDARLIDLATGILPDEVVGIVGRATTRGTRGDDGLIILDELVRPELPLDHPQHWGAPGGAVFVSDVHIGSDTFIDGSWDAFIDWLALRRNEGRDLAGGVRWVVINGDLVEGVGIYPGQQSHLAIPDVMDQYAEAARMLRRIPEHVRVIISPGNHDAVRPAEPQPAFPQAIRDLFPPNVTCVGNPCLLNLDGTNVLAYHGVSLFDYFQALPNVDINHPLETMREMLVRRHLCPIYGGKTPLAPEHRDYMVIESIPDIFVTGHVHAADVAEYRGVTLINSSTWQAQTDYQKMLGFVPNPCKAFHIDLATGRPTVLDFLEAPDHGDPAVATKAVRRLAA